MQGRLAGLIYSGILATLFLSTINRCHAEETESVSEVYQKKVYKSGNQRLLYRFLSPPEIKSGEKYPLVLFLHGAGERGNDNTIQLVHGLSEFVKVDNRSDFPCFVIAPQCPAEKKWVEVDWTKTEHDMPEKMSVSLKLTDELLQQISEESPIDTNRIYITGLSMGGYGTWDFIQRKPNYFAAAIPICGGADENYADRLIKLPLWAFHGDQDNAVPLIRTTRMIAAIKKAEGNPKMTIYPGVGHNSWTQTYANREVLRWLFDQHRHSSKCE
jgi:predicted peptidase